jgi:hypothetical protein
MGFVVSYAGEPLITWDDGSIDGDPAAVAAVNERVAAGGAVPGVAVNSFLPATLDRPDAAYATIYNALLGTVWSGMITVTGDIGADTTAPTDPNLIY